YDLAGFIVGLVEAGSHREPIKVGDVLVGLPSTGLHTNGYSLARKVFANVPLSGVLADELMAPHVSYLSDLARIRWKGAAHITGGGILGNLPRCLPEGIAARLDCSAWKVPPIFDLIRERGRVADDEMYATFNMGLGMIMVVAPDAVANRLINVHPSLLPLFAGGLDAVERALASGVEETGATVHLVTADVDAGPILLQQAVPIRAGDTVQTLRERVHEAEYRILPQAVRLMEVRLADSSPVR